MTDIFDKNSNNMKTKNLFKIDKDRYIFNREGSVFSKKCNRKLGWKWHQDPRYNAVCLKLTDGTFKQFLVHDVIAFMYIDFPSNIAWEDLVVDHIKPVSEGGTDAVENLRWTDSKGNANNENTRKNLSSSKTGCKQSSETIAKRVKKNLGKKRTSEQCNNISKGKMKPIVQIDPITGEIVCQWESAKTAAATLGVSRGNIASCIHNHRKSAYGYVWKSK